MKKWVVINIFLSFLLIVWGGVVRNFGAGLSCPDWPLCHGQIIPPLDFLVLIEWGHRLLASIVGFLTLGICIASLGLKDYRSLMGRASLLSVFLIVVQAVLGGMTVKGLLAPQWVTAHLAVGLLFFVTLLWMLCKVIPQFWGNTAFSVGNLLNVLLSTPASVSSLRPCLPLKTEGFHFYKKSRAIFFAIYFSTILVYCQMVLGGWVSSSGAGLACPDFPTCFGEWIPPLVGQVKLQFFHRVLAFGVLICVFVTWLFMHHWGADVFIRRWIGISLFVTLLQVSLGIGNVLFKIQKILSIAHLAVGTTLFALLFVITYKVRHVSLS